MAIFEELRSVGKVLQEAGKIEQYKQILETLEKLLQMQKKISELEEENKILKDQSKIKRNLTYENDAYWVGKNDNKEGPFCSKCWDADTKLVRMHYYEHSNIYNCPNCKNSIKRK